MGAVRKARLGRVYAGASAEHRLEERREKLIEAGVELIGTKGFPAMTVRGVCHEAGLTERYFYESFKNREALMVAVFEHVSALMRAHMVQGAQGAANDPESMARRVITAMLSWLRADPRRARILYFETLGTGASTRERLLNDMHDFAQLILTLFRPLVGSGGWAAHDEEIVATALVGAFNQIVMRWALSNYEKPVDVLVDNGVAIITALVKGTAGSPAS